MVAIGDAEIRSMILEKADDYRMCYKTLNQLPVFWIVF